MRIEGKIIAEGILTDLSQKIKKFKITPTLAIIQIGNDPASQAYIKQKQLAAEKIGARLVHSSQVPDISTDELKKIIQTCNTENSIHGIIVQRPIPDGLQVAASTVALEKDIDGFLPGSPYEVPVALAVHEILKNIQADLSKNIVIIGRGETAGKPIADYFRKLECATSVITSQTPNQEKILKNADIIISCVGKERIISKENIKPGCILISVGIWRDSLGKLHGDYEGDDIADIASYYTPTPGGVGPVNVACLMQNLIHATQKHTIGLVTTPLQD